MKPKGKAGLVAVERLGRTTKTGNFDKGVSNLMAHGHSMASAKAIMGSQYWAQVKKHMNGGKI